MWDDIVNYDESFFCSKKSLTIILNITFELSFVTRLDSEMGLKG